MKRPPCGSGSPNRRHKKSRCHKADLSLIWQGQRFPPEALTTADGRAVEVINPGRRGGGSGPDFIDAVVLLDGVERRGDVELHVRASSFHGHGHDADPAYDAVALHVVFRADETETRLFGGGLVPVAAFAPWLEGRSQELQSWLAAPEIWQEPCRGVSGRLGPGLVSQALEEADRLRFETRVVRMCEAIASAGADEALWRGLLDTLGVGGDRDGFRRLAQVLPVSMAVQIEDLAAALLYVAGLGPAPDGETVELPPPMRPGLQSSGRPANRPQVRLAGMAALLRRVQAGPGDASADALREMAMQSVAEAEGRNQLLMTWSVPPQIGPARAQELVVNAVLPFAAARGLREEALRLLSRLPASASYGKTAFLEANLRPEKGRVARNALQSQGRWVTWRSGAARAAVAGARCRAVEAGGTHYEDGGHLHASAKGASGNGVAESKL
jgi:Protein of unknown function (DUF2851)